MSPKTTLRYVVLAVAFSAASASLAGCAVRAEADYPVAGYSDYPPDAYIATTTPIYFEGRAAYWYGDHWYYRDGGRWHYFSREPRVLYERRMHAPPPMRAYEGPRRREVVVRPAHPEPARRGPVVVARPAHPEPHRPEEHH